MGPKTTYLHVGEITLCAPRAPLYLAYEGAADNELRAGEMTDTCFDSGLVLPVFGEIDVANADALHEQALSLGEGGRAFGILDMSELTFIDSTGLSALIDARKQLLQMNCAMRLVITRPNIRKVFEITGLTEVFDIYASVEAAAA